MNMPQSVRSVLWSYDTSSLDHTRDRERIVTNVLNLGTFEATPWLRKTYTEEELAEVVAHPKPGEWNKSSLARWSLIYPSRSSID